MHDAQFRISCHPERVQQDNLRCCVTQRMTIFCICHSEEGSNGTRRKNLIPADVSQRKRPPDPDNGNETLTSFRCAPLLRVTKTSLRGGRRPTWQSHSRRRFPCVSQLCIVNCKESGLAPKTDGTVRSTRRTPPRGRGWGWGRQLQTRPEAVNMAVGNSVTVSQTLCIARPDTGNEIAASRLSSLLAITPRAK